MPIKSYLAHPYSRKKNELSEAISCLSHCEVIPAQNENILIVVTETETMDEEKFLKSKLETIKSLKLLTMVSGFNTNKIK